MPVIDTFIAAGLDMSVVGTFVVVISFNVTAVNTLDSLNDIVLVDFVCVTSVGGSADVVAFVLLCVLLRSYSFNAYFLLPLTA